MESGAKRGGFLIGPQINPSTPSVELRTYTKIASIGLRSGQVFFAFAVRHPAD